MTNQVPEIARYGARYVSYYTDAEYTAALWRAFIQRRADFIVLDDNPRGQKFLAANVAWAMEKGWLYCSQSEDDGQSVVSAFRLTPAGKRALSEYRP